MKLALGCLAIVSLVSWSSFQVSPPVDPPPKELRETEKMWNKKWTEANGLIGHVAYYTNSKKLTMSWRHSTGASATQDIALSFYPTALFRGGVDLLFVGGRNQLGQTVIQSMMYVPPTVTIGSGGVVTIGTASVTGINVLYHEKTVGRDMVRFMRATLYNPSKLVVQFWDSRDLYTLDTASGAYVKIASPTSGAGVLQVTHLQDHFDKMWFAEHVSYGYVYVLLSAKHNSVDPLVIYDTNKDGVLDGYLSIPRDQWATCGFESAFDFVRFE